MTAPYLRLSAPMIEALLFVGRTPRVSVDFIHAGTQNALARRRLIGYGGGPRDKHTTHLTELGRAWVAGYRAGQRDGLDEGVPC